MYSGRNYKKELLSIENFEDYKAARIREKRLFMERWNLLEEYGMYFDECSLHEVEVQLKDMSKEQIPAFIKEEFVKYYELLEVDDNYVRLLYFLDCSCDPADIDVVLFYIFGDYELGEYHSYHVR